MATVQQLKKQDVLFVAGETSNVYQHTAGLVVLDTSASPGFNFDTFRDKVTERIRMVPHFQWKLHEVPLGLDLPYWVEDQNFSFDHHIKRIAVPTPGDREALSQVVAHLYSKHLDRRKPLWEIWFIEGLADGKFAILQKLHHCLMDGQGAMKLGEILCDLSPDAEARPVDDAIAGARAGEVPGQLQLSASTALHLARFPGAAYRGIYDFFRPKILSQLGWSKQNKAEKPQVALASFNGEIGCERGFIFGSLPVADIKVVKNAFSVSVNDVILALVGTSMRNYLQAYSVLPDAPLRALMPISLRTEGDDEFSNKVTNTSVTLGTDCDDPVARLQAISAEAEQAKQQGRSGGMGLMEVMQIMPPLLVNAMLNTTSAEQAPQMIGANLVVSSVRGGSEPLYIAGARMETMYPMSIITDGMGINFTCVSYADSVDVGVTIEPDLVPEPWVIIDGLDAALQEYLVLSDKKPRRKKSVARRSSGKKPSREAAAKTRSKSKSKARPKSKAGPKSKARSRSKAMPVSKSSPKGKQAK